jgi:hypothetical protein
MPPLTAPTRFKKSVKFGIIKAIPVTNKTMIVLPIIDLYFKLKHPLDLNHECYSIMSKTTKI